MVMKVQVLRIQQAGENHQERDIMRSTRKAKSQYKRAWLVAHTLMKSICGGSCTPDSGADLLACVTVEEVPYLVCTVSNLGSTLCK